VLHVLPISSFIYINIVSLCFYSIKCSFYYCFSKHRPKSPFCPNLQCGKPINLACCCACIAKCLSRHFIHYFAHSHFPFPPTVSTNYHLTYVSKPLTRTLFLVRAIWESKGTSKNWLTEFAAHDTSPVPTEQMTNVVKLSGSGANA
jgi:hypothetical protein